MHKLTKVKQWAKMISRIYFKSTTDVNKLILLSFFWSCRSVGSSLKPSPKCCQIKVCFLWLDQIFLSLSWTDDLMLPPFRWLNPLVQPLITLLTQKVEHWSKHPPISPSLFSIKQARTQWQKLCKGRKNNFNAHKSIPETMYFDFP